MITLKTVIPAALNQIRPGSTFLSIKNYKNNHQGRYNFGIVFHVNYLNAVRRAVNTWYQYKPCDDIETRMRADLINSYTDTLNGRNERSLSAHAYQRVSDGQNVLNGIKYHTRGACVHMWGFLVHRVELSPSIYPPSNRSAQAITRQRLIKMTPLSKFRQFDSIGVEHLTLTQKDLIKTL